MHSCALRCAVVTRGVVCRDDEDTAAGLATTNTSSIGANGAALPNVPLWQRQSKPKPSAPELPVRPDLTSVPSPTALHTLPSLLSGRRQRVETVLYAPYRYGATWLWAFELARFCTHCVESVHCLVCACVHATASQARSSAHRVLIITRSTLPPAGTRCVALRAVPFMLCRWHRQRLCCSRCATRVSHRCQPLACRRSRELESRPATPAPSSSQRPKPANRRSSLKCRPGPVHGRC